MNINVYYPLTNQHVKLDYLLVKDEREPEYTKKEHNKT